MATYYVYSGATGTADGLSWANAFTSFGAAVTAATANGDTILVHKTHVESLTAAVSYSFAANVIALCVDMNAGNALSVMDGSTGAISTTGNLTLAGAKNVYIYGLCFQITGASAQSLTVTNTSGAHYELEQCKLWLNNTSASSSLTVGVNGGWTTCYTKLIDCDCMFGNTSQKFIASQTVDIIGGRVNPTGAAPSTLFNMTQAASGLLTVTDCDLSVITGTLFNDATGGARRAFLSNCKLGTGVVMMATQSKGNLSASEIFVFNCSSGNNHFEFGHFSGLGSTVAVTTPYANDGALYDGTNHVTWRIVTTANASFTMPYVSPWIDRYEGNMSAIMPSLEILRDGNVTAFNNNEVWGEWSYQGTVGYPLGVRASDRMTPLSTPAPQTTSSKTAADWTGENATAWFGTLTPPASITPAVIGHLRARVCVGAPSTTLYVDPTIRGA